MRDIKRIDRILDKLKELWKQIPDQRFGQIIENYIEVFPLHECIFHIEDNLLEENLDLVLEDFKKWKVKLGKGNNDIK